MKIEHIESWNYYDGPICGLLFADDRLCWYNISGDCHPGEDAPRTYDVWLMDAEAIRRATDELVRLRDDRPPREASLDAYLAERPVLTRLAEDVLRGG